MRRIAVTHKFPVKISEIFYDLFYESLSLFEVKTSYVHTLSIFVDILNTRILVEFRLKMFYFTKIIYI